MHYWYTTKILYSIVEEKSKVERKHLKINGFVQKNVVLLHLTTH